MVLRRNSLTAVCASWGRFWKITPNKSSKQLQGDLEQPRVEVSARTIHSTLNHVGLGRGQKQARLVFAKTFIDKPKSF